MCGCVDGWMDVWMCGWVDRWVGGWMGGWVDRWSVGCVTGWLIGWVMMLHSPTGKPDLTQHSPDGATDAIISADLSHCHARG